MSLHAVSVKSYVLQTPRLVISLVFVSVPRFDDPCSKQGLNYSMISVMHEVTKSILPLDTVDASASPSLILLLYLSSEWHFRGGLVWLQYAVRFNSSMGEQFELGIKSSAIESDTSYRVYFQFPRIQTGVNSGFNAWR